MGGGGVDSCGSREGQVAGCCEHCDEISGFVKRGEYFD
jgi:hypothetical protein